MPLINPSGGVLDITGLTAADPALGDELPAYDVSAAANRKVTADKFGFLMTGLVGGRLTLTSGTPVTTADVVAAGTLYYAPYLHDKISLYDGTRWKMYTFTERSLSLTLTSGKNYDVFLYDNAGTLTLELSAAWTNDTTRADALTTQDGVYVKSGATTRRYLGTIRASGTNTTEDSITNRYVVNLYNAIQRVLRCTPGYSDGNTETTYTTTSTSYTAANGGTNSSFNFLLPLAGWPVSAMLSMGLAVNAASIGFAGIGVDSTTAATATIRWAAAANNGQTGSTSYVDNTLAAGKHTLNVLIAVNANTGTYYADTTRQGSAADPRVGFMEGWVMG